MKNNFILCRIGPAFYLQTVAKGKKAANKAFENLHHPNDKFFLQEGRVKDKA
jgi:hypothetical protein